MSEGVRRALLVGVANYDQATELTSLRTPKNDVAKLEHAISQDNCGFVVQTLVDPTSNDLSCAIMSIFREAARDDTVLLYFSGHGKIAQAGGLCLCTKDTSEEFLDRLSVGVRFIRQQIDATKAARVILLLDCCYSGLATGEFKGDVRSAITDAVGTGKGKYVVTSSSRTQTSIELKDDENSLFTKWMVHGLESFEADGNKDGVITLDELVDYISERVKEQRPEQNPQKFGFETTSSGWIEIARRPGSSLEQPAPSLEWLSAIAEDISNKNIIFFLGTGVYGGGALGSFELIKAVGRQAKLDVSGQNSLAAAAEYWFQVMVVRENFLDRYRRILSSQSEKSSPSAVHDLLVGLDAPWLVISSTHDLVLEKLLDGHQIPYVLIAHIVGPEGGEHVNRVLVMRRGPQPAVEICNSDEVRIDVAKDRVVYKLLGSPCLTELAATGDGIDWSSIDTAVVTEADHIAFLGNVHNKRTGTPTAFSRFFTKSSILFLGYNLDIWNYRLIAQVCLAENTRRGSKPPLYAVRQPTSSFEMVFWERLQARMLETDVDTFIRSLQKLGPGP